MALTVLIAAPEHLAALQQHSDLTDAAAFTDADALKAFETIARERPALVAIEKLFASTARGAALINRIKADPALAACEIRLFEPVQPVSAPSSPTEPAEPSPGDDFAAESMAAEPKDARRAPRVAITRNIEVMIDGNPATLVNISMVGAQVTSSLALRPNQRVRMSLEDADRPVRFNGVVAWATFEMPKDGPRYRAGINFYDASPEMVARFIETISG